MIKIRFNLHIAAVFVLQGIAFGADTKGIKAANLKGADIDLMNNHDPISELENFELLPGYQANLFASDPMLANPVHMHWDSRGRLWVACSWSYPQLKPGDVADDKIIILEDTDDDGFADKSTVFADGLYLPTGIELANGGCYVGQSPDVFVLKDTDGDDVADVKEMVLTGFGIEDSHHSISAWRRGPGGWIYFQEGIFLHAQVETQYGVLRNFNGGVYQFNPRTQELRMFCRGTGGNPWGHVFDRWGQSFMVNNPRIMYLSPSSGNGGEAVPVKALISTEKQCGGDIATGTHVGDDLRGQLLTGRFKSRAVVRYEFIEDGAGFKANVLAPLLTSKHPNFRPVDVKTGPDGAIYVADWYNSIINHAQHDFRDPRRDHDHGRIWRISHKDRPLVEKPKLVGASVEDLVGHLKSPEDWTRHQARKELSERDPGEVVAVAESWVESLSPDLPNYDHHLVEAMWACQNVGRASEKILERVLLAEDGHARSAGARVIRYWHDQLSDPVGMIAKASGDPFPRTRMEAVLSAGFVPKAEAFAAALHSLDHPGDPALDKALPQTMKALEAYWRPAMEAGTLEFSKPSHREFVEAGAGMGFSKRLAQFLLKRDPSGGEIAQIKADLIQVGTEKEIGKVVGALTKRRGVQSTGAAIALLESLETMADPGRSGALGRRVDSLKVLLGSESEAVAELAARNLSAWNVAGSGLVAVLKDASRSAALRGSAAVGISKFRKAGFRDVLEELAKEGDAEGRYAAVMGLVHSDLDAGMESAIKLMTDDPGNGDPVPLVRAILRDRKGRRMLLDALKDVDIHPKVVARVGEFHRESGLLPPQLARLFQPHDSAVSLSVSLLAEDPKSLSADVVQHGVAVRGEMIYRRKSLACAGCHAIGSAGPSIGPNLVAVGAAASPEYMVESILKPNAAIAEHYENRLFTLVDGSVEMGVVTFKSEKEIVLRDSARAGKEVRLAASEVVKEQAMPSLMPAGLADQLKSRSEFLDLAKFLSVLGRPGEFANDERPVIRKWRVIAAPDDGRLPGEDAAWVSAYSKVGGDLPTEDMALGETVLARGFIDVQVSGSVELEIEEPAGVSLWVDGKRIGELAKPIKLEKGRRCLTFGLRPEQRREVGLRVELKAADEAVRFQPEGGI